MRVLDGAGGTLAGEGDIAYWYLAPGTSRARVDELIARIGSDLNRVEHAVYAPDLDPVAVGDLAAAGAFLLSGQLFVDADPADIGVAGERIRAILP